MNKRTKIVIIVFFLIITTVMSACTSKKEEKYKVLFGGASDSMSALVYPVDIGLGTKKDTERDEDVWPDEMSIVFDGQSYDCSFDQVYRMGINTGYQYAVKNQNQDGKKDLIRFVLNDNREIVGYLSLRTLSEDEKGDLTQITEEKAVEIAEQVFHKYFDADYSDYKMTVKKNEDCEYYEFLFYKNYDPPIGVSDNLMVWVSIYGELLWFNGLRIGSVPPPKEEPDPAEVRQCIEKRIVDLLEDNGVLINKLNIDVDIDNLALGYNDKTKKYELNCVVSVDCNGIVDGFERDIHDLVQIIVVCDLNRK